MKTHCFLVLFLFSLLSAFAENPIQEEIVSLPIEPVKLNSSFLVDEEQGSDHNALFIAEDEAPVLENITSERAKQELKIAEELKEPSFTYEIKDLPLAATQADASIVNLESSSSALERAYDIQVDIKRAFIGSPIIYLALLAMSICALFIWIYCLLSLKKVSSVPSHLMGSLRSNLGSNQFDTALSLCNTHRALLCQMVAIGIQSRRAGLTAVAESMKAQGKLSSMRYWQKIGLLNDIAILAPMLGLLGTVLGMFYAFYDINRSIESISSLFDGLGISVGTTVAGLIVAILALILHSTAKYRLIKSLASIEAQAQGIACLIDDHTSLYSSPNGAT
jgi:biopolymer transport protein ExbB